MAVAALSLAAAVARLRATDALETFSPLVGEPLLAVDLAAASDEPKEDELAAALAALVALPCPSIALVPAAPTGGRAIFAARCDLTLADTGEFGSLAAAVARAPLAAGTLAQLLRLGEQLDVEGGLVAESLAYATLQAGPEHAAWRAGRERRPRAPERTPAVSVHRDGDRLCLTLNRPARRNAFAAEMRDALCEGLDLALCDDSIREVVLDGAGPAFCSGGDLDEFGTHPDPATAHSIRSTRSAARRIALCAPRVRAELHGACVGAGVELPAFAGRVVAREDASFALPELAMGLVPGSGGTVSLPRRIGRQRTAYLALSGSRIDAATALRWGLVDEIAGAPPA